MDNSRLQFYLDKHPFREHLDDAKNPTGHIFTCPVRLAFANLDPEKPKVNKRNPAKKTWGGLLIVPPAANVAALMAAVNREAVTRFGDKVVRSGSLKIGVKKQAKLAEKYQGFSADGIYVDASSNFPVPLLARDGSPDTFHADRWYSGMWCLARVRLYTYPKPGGPSDNQGVGVGLVSLKKLADDDQFKSSGDATEGFDDVADHSGNGAAPAAPPAANAFAKAFADLLQ